MSESALNSKQESSRANDEQKLLIETAERLRGLQAKDEKSARDLKNQQGFIGSGIDAVVNFVDRSFSTPDKMADPKSHFVTYGSHAMNIAIARQEKELAALERAAKESNFSLFESQFKKLTGKDFKPAELRETVDAQGQETEKLRLSSRDAIQKYKENHFFYHDLSSTYGAVYAGFLGRHLASSVSRSFTIPFLAAMAAGALAKPLLTGLDGEHFNFKRDLLVGAIWGGLYPVYEWSGARTSEMLLRSPAVNKFIGRGQNVLLENPGLFSSAIRPVKGSLLRSAAISDAAFVVPGWVAYDSVGYPAQLMVDRSYFQKELPSIGETGVSHAKGIAAGLVLGPLMGIPIAQGTRYVTMPLLTRAGKLLKY